MRTPSCRYFQFRFLQTLLCIGLVGASHASIADARYELDPEHLTVGFLVRHLGYADTMGFFRKASGSYSFDEATRTLGNVRVVVDTASVFTGHEKRDNHLRGSDFLNIARAPQMTFTANSANWTGDKTFLVDGELELLGKRRPLRLTGTLNKSALYPIGSSGSKPYVMGVSLRGTVKRSEWGMDYAVANGWVGDEVQLIIEFEAKRTAATATGEAAKDNSPPFKAEHPGDTALSQDERGNWRFRSFPGLATLYVYDKDTPGKSNCGAPCASAWAPLIASTTENKPIGDWTLVARPDGRHQWAYKGRPIYLRYHDLPADAGNIQRQGFRKLEP